MSMRSQQAVTIENPWPSDVNSDSDVDVDVDVDVW